MTEKDIGALWLKTKSDGGQYFSGVILMGEQKVNIVIFPNGFKTDAKHPDFKIYFQRPKSQEQAQTGTDEVPPEARVEQSDYPA